LANLIVVKRNNQKINKSIPADFIDIKFIPTSSSELRTLPQVNYLTPLVAQYIAIYGVYIINQVKPLMSIERFHHTIRVTQLAIEIGKTISTKLAFSAYIACMYHDIAKEMSDQKVKKLVGN
jgi:nicotinate-nucleotide adenylyltransferase